MRPNRVKASLASGGVAFGTSVIEFSTTGLPRIAAVAGVDFILLDTEHTGWTSDTLRPLLAVTRSVDVVPMVRVAGLDKHAIGTALDLGAMGIMVPSVETAEEAQRIVSYARYPPAGVRGAAFGIAHDDFTPGDRPGSMASADRETLLIALVETPAGIDDIDGIAATDGIDIVWVGQVDLTLSLGIVGQYDHASYTGALERVVAAARRHGKALGFTATSIEEAERMLGIGFRCISFWNDLRIYQSALSAATRGLRETASRLGIPDGATDAPHAASGAGS
jgi:2-dehydro-3-deoxyglucarate aldolase/4-hydroxy-2-oxoheptanedioate aldolase